MTQWGRNIGPDISSNVFSAASLYGLAIVFCLSFIGLSSLVVHHVEQWSVFFLRGLLTLLGRGLLLSDVSSSLPRFARLCPTDDVLQGASALLPYCSLQHLLIVLLLQTGKTPSTSSTRVRPLLPSLASSSSSLVRLSDLTSDGPAIPPHAQMVTATSAPRTSRLS